MALDTDTSTTEMASSSEKLPLFGGSKMVGATLACLLLAMFLVSGKLLEIAERQPLGATRDRWVDVAEAVDRTANFFSLNRPYDLITDVRGVGTDAGEKLDSIAEVAANLRREASGAEASGATEGPSLEPSVPVGAEESGGAGPGTGVEPSVPAGSGSEPELVEPESTGSDGAEPESGSPDGPELEPPVPGDAGSGSGSVGAGLSGLGAESGSSDGPLIEQQFDIPLFLQVPDLLAGPAPKLRTVTPDEPLRVYVAGDSQSFYLGHELDDDGAGEVLDVTVDSRHSTGLSRPDFFNWPAQFLEVVQEQDPELMVIFLGSNDWQDMESEDGIKLKRGSVEWDAEWAWRVGITFDVLAAEHRHIVWVSLPPARDNPFRTGYPEINEASYWATVGRADVTLIDIWDLFGGDGPYEEDISPPDGGNPARVRQEDGVHLNRRGSEWVAALVREVVADRWDLVTE